jgi:protein O-mannosyl-transferase
VTVPRTPPKRATLRTAAVCFALALVTLAAFWGVLSNGFLNYDDNFYVTENAHVLQEVTRDSVRWAFTTTYFGFYYPLTWLSHMLDVQLFGLWAGGHHLTSLLLHVLNTLLLFLLLSSATGAFWRSSAVALLFAIHPLHVESVAWIAERKDVLSSFFGFACLLAYAAYAAKPTVGRYVPVLASFLLGLLAKPMIITLPLVLLLLDYWPLGRWPSGGHPSRFAPPGNGPGRPATVKRLVLEKLPLLALVPVFAWVTVLSQKQAQALVSVETLPIYPRVANALASYWTYVAKMFAPVGLAVFYPHPNRDLSFGRAALCGLALLAATGAVLWFGRERKYLSVGWLWYLGTLVPVIGLVQVGPQAMADRYTYLPLTGLFILVVWGSAEMAGAARAARFALSGIAGVVLLSLVFMTRAQVGFWNSSRTLFEHALAVTSGSYVAHYHLAATLEEQGRKDEALSHYQEALRIEPGFAPTRCNLGKALADAGRAEEAAEQFEQALRIDPRYADAHNAFGALLLNLGRADEAIGHFRETLSLKPGDTEALSSLGQAYARKGQIPESVSFFEEALQTDPDNPNVRIRLATALLGAGRTDEAIGHLNLALAARPDSAEALRGLGQALARSGRTGEAIDRFQQAVRADPDYAEARNGLGVALDHAGKTTEAVEQFRQAVRIRPDYSEALNNLGLALARSGRLAEAIESFQKSVRANPDFADAWSNLGVAMSRAGRGPEAAECFRKAAALQAGPRAGSPNPPAAPDVARPGSGSAP